MAISISWAVIFRFWQPRVLTQEEKEANLELSSVRDYVEEEEEHLLEQELE